MNAFFLSWGLSVDGKKKHTFTMNKVENVDIEPGLQWNRYDWFHLLCWIFITFTATTCCGFFHVANIDSKLFSNVYITIIWVPGVNANEYLNVSQTLKWPEFYPCQANIEGTLSCKSIVHISVDLPRSFARQKLNSPLLFLMAKFHLRISSSKKINLQGLNLVENLIPYVD